MKKDIKPNPPVGTAMRITGDSTYIGKDDRINPLTMKDSLRGPRLVKIKKIIDIKKQ